MATLFWSVTAFCIVINLIKDRKELSPRRAVEISLLYILFIDVGWGSLLAFYGHTFLADKVAASIGWPAGNPFQFEVAGANLAFGVLGLLCIRFRDNFWLATGVGYAVFLFVAAYGHVRQMITAGNYAVNNAGPILLIGDIVVPLLILVLLFLRWKLRVD